jgi:hypothetical protein
MSTAQSDRTKAVLSRASSVYSPADLPKPHWLKEGTYDGPLWVVVDDLPTSPKPERRIRWDVQLSDPKRPGERCFLTDPEYSQLLDTVKRQSYALRVGKHATVTTAQTYAAMCRRIVNWAVWMIQNSIYRFSDLDQDDFDSYAEAAHFGPGFLLGYGPRLIEFVTKLERNGEELPNVERDRVGLPTLEVRRLLQAAGIDPYMGAVDHAVAYEITRLSKSRGFHMHSRQLERLSRGLPQPKKLSTIQTLQTLQPWEYQWRMRHQLPGDKIVFNPFDDVSLYRMAREFGGRSGRTKTAPVQQTMELVDRSIRWVLDYAPVLLDLRDKYFETLDSGLRSAQRLDFLSPIILRTVIPDGPGRPFPINGNSKRTTTPGLELGVAVNRFVPTACAIVICAFTGRRHNEVLTLRAAGSRNQACISHDENGFWIEAFIEKTSQEWVKTPCNELVAAAVKILERWSAPARTISGKPGLFQLRRLSFKAVVRFYLRTSLKEFATFLQLTPLLDGSQWEFLPHQFRRFFAIMYFWHYHYRNLAALSHHYRHFDPAMTLTYVTEHDTGVIFREVDKEHTTTLLCETALGERNLSGAFGERFKSIAMKLYRRYRRSTKVVAPRLVSKLVERYVNASGRRLKVMPWGYCACRTTAQELNTARCLRNSSARNSGGPDFGSSSPTVCCDCPHHATDKVFEPFLLTQIEFHKRAAADPKNGRLLRITSQEHVEKVRAHCQRAFQDSKPLEVPGD